MMWVRSLGLFGALLFGALLFGACSDTAGPKNRPDSANSESPAASSQPTMPPESPPADASAWFVDIAGASGVGAFQQRNGDPDKHHITGPNGAGCGLFDADGDGRVDVFLINGSQLGGFPENEAAPSNALYLNRGGGCFEDATQSSGLQSRGSWGQGCAIADVDGDSSLDLFVANNGPDALYLNDGSGHFANRAASANLDDTRWASSGCWFDADRDGDLDLYVTHYIDLPPGIVANGIERFVLSEWQGFPVMKGPRGLPGCADAFYVNLGDGTFEDATEASGMGAAIPAFGFQPVATDYDLDGDMDVFVSNDSTPNFLWRNQGSLSFEDQAFSAGVAYDSSGKNQSCMGVALADFDGNGWQDIFITNFSNEMNILYRNLGSGHFEESTVPTGLATNASSMALAWGTALFDCENDGDLDLFIANGHVYPIADQVGKGYSYAQRNFLFLQGERERFTEVGVQAGPGLAVEAVSRGSAVGDIDDDGDLDILVNNLDSRPTLLRNDSPSKGASIEVRLRGHSPNTSAIGARVEVKFASRTLVRELVSSSSFLSHDDLRLHFGLGEVDTIDSIVVHWPNGASSRFDHSAQQPLETRALYDIQQEGTVLRRIPWSKR